MESNEYFKKIFEDKRSKNPRFSLRALAQKAELSPSYLSQVINYKSKLTLKVAYQLSEKLKLDDHQRDQLVLLIIKDSLKSEWIKKEVTKKLQTIRNNPKGENIQHVSTLRELYKEKQIHAYFSPEKDRVRNLNLFPNIKKEYPEFGETIICAKEGVASEVFFIPNEENRYTCYVSLFNGATPYRDEIQFTANKSIRIEWEHGYPKIHSICMQLAGKDEYLLTNIFYSKNCVTVDGERFSYSESHSLGPYFLEHKRI